MEKEIFNLEEYNKYLKLQKKHHEIYLYSDLWYSITSVGLENHYINDSSLSVKYIYNLGRKNKIELKYKNNKYILSNNIIPKVPSNKSNQYVLFKVVFNPYFKKYKINNNLYKNFLNINIYIDIEKYNDLVIND